MKSLALLRKGISDCGFAEHFTVAGRDFRAVTSNRIYPSAEVRVLSTLRFSGTDAQTDLDTQTDGITQSYHAELYLLETRDGVKGIFER